MNLSSQHKLDSDVGKHAAVKYHVTHVVYLSDRAGAHVLGGAETQLWHLLPELVAAGVSVEAIVLIWHPGPRVTVGLQQLEQSGVRVTVIKRTPWRGIMGKLRASFAVFTELSQLLSKRRDRIINLHLDHVFVVLAALFAGCHRIIFSFHADHPDYCTLRFQLWFKILNLRISRFTALSQYVAKHVTENLKIPATKLAIVPYGISIREESQRLASRPTRDTYGLPSDAPLIGFVGRFTEQKNLFVLLAAMKLLPKYHLALFGGGPQQQQLEEFISANELKNVSIVGPVAEGRLAMTLCDTLCLPSTWEGLGLVLLEAMAERVAVVAAQAGAIPEVLGGGEYGVLFDPRDPKACAAAIESATQPGAERDARIMKAYSWVQFNYSLTAASESYIAALSEVKK